MLLKIGRHSLPVEHLDKLYFPHDGFTKKTLIDYYEGIAYFMLPHMHNRPLMMHRFPNGIHEEGFYQKDVPSHFPAWIHTLRVKKKTEPGSTRYLICHNTATLVYLATQACITLHRWLSTSTSLNHPDCMIFDIDPPHHMPIDFTLIATIARSVKEIIESYHLTPYVMTTGSRGVHIIVPLIPHTTFAHVRTFARSIAQKVANKHPDHATLSSSISHRGNKLLIDIMRNAYGATAVAPYSLRALPGAPIATPILWEELNISVTSSQAYTLTTIGQRLVDTGNVWHTMHQHRKSLRGIINI